MRIGGAATRAWGATGGRPEATRLAAPSWAPDVLRTLPRRRGKERSLIEREGCDRQRRCGMPSGRQEPSPWNSVFDLCGSKTRQPCVPSPASGRGRSRSFVARHPFPYFISLEGRTVGKGGQGRVALGGGS